MWPSAWRTLGTQNSGRRSGQTSRPRGKGGWQSDHEIMWDIMGWIMGYEWKAQAFPANLLGTNQLLVGKSVGYIFGEPRKICERIAADGIHSPNLNFSWVTPPISMGSILVFGGSIPVFLGLNPIFFGHQKLLWPTPPLGRSAPSALRCWTAARSRLFAKKRCHRRPLTRRPWRMMSSSVHNSRSS